MSLPQPRDQLSEDGTNELCGHLEAYGTWGKSKVSFKNLLKFRLIVTVNPFGHGPGEPVMQGDDY